MNTQENESLPPTAKKFDRHRILYENYKSLLRDDINFAVFSAICDENLEWDKEQDCFVGRAWLGTVFALTPSGKVYAPWTTNQTRSDVIKDEAWWDALNDLADENNLYVTGDSGDICLEKCLGVDSFCDGYIEAIGFTESLQEPIPNESKTMLQAVKDCADFQINAKALLDEARSIRQYTDKSAGADFWFSRNRHGVGFFDRGTEPVWKKLQELAKIYGSVNIEEREYD